MPHGPRQFFTCLAATRHNAPKRPGGYIPIPASPRQNRTCQNNTCPFLWSSSSEFMPSHDPLALPGGTVVISKRGRFSQAGRQPIRDGVRENGQPKESGLLFWEEE